MAGDSTELEYRTCLAESGFIPSRITSSPKPRPAAAERMRLKSAGGDGTAWSGSFSCDLVCAMVCVGRCRVWASKSIAFAQHNAMGGI